MNFKKITICILFLAKNVAGTVHTVNAGDADDFITKLGFVADYDTILLPPGDYIFDDDPNYEGYQSLNLCDFMPPAQYPNKPNLYITGTGETRSDVKLVAAQFWLCARTLVIENLSMYTLVSGGYGNAPVLEDTDTGMMFRNTYVQVPVYATPAGSTEWAAFYIILHRMAIMYSKIETNPPVPSLGTNIGLATDGYGLAVIGSTFAGFQLGLDLMDLNCSNQGPGCQPDADELNRNYKLYGNNLSSNTVGSNGDAVFLDLFAPNTPSGVNVNVNTFIDVLRYQTNVNSPYVPVKMKFKKVVKKGETTIYRLPSAYPEPPTGLTSAAVPQYYRFDTTAKFGKKSIVRFKKTQIYSNFSGFSGTLTCMFFDYSAGATWKLVNYSIEGSFYKFKFPNFKVQGTVAFFEG